MNHKNIPLVFSSVQQLDILKPTKMSEDERAELEQDFRDNYALAIYFNEDGSLLARQPLPFLLEIQKKARLAKQELTYSIYSISDKKHLETLPDWITEAVLEYDDEPLTTFEDGYSFLVVTHNQKVLRVVSDYMSPEDALFYRDLSWVHEALSEAYQLGIEDGKRVASIY